MSAVKTAGAWEGPPKAGNLPRLLVVSGAQPEDVFLRALRLLAKAAGTPASAK